MKFSDFVVREAILTDLQATTKEGAIHEIVCSLHHAGALKEADLESITRGLLSREEVGSTGIGQGMAFSETRHPAVDRVVGTIALSRRGVEFDALDGEPVDLLFLLISANGPGHLRAMEVFNRHLDIRFVTRLYQAQTREQVIALLEEADQEPLEGADQRPAELPEPRRVDAAAPSGLGGLHGAARGVSSRSAPSRTSILRNVTCSTSRLRSGRSESRRSSREVYPLPSRMPSKPPGRPKPPSALGAKAAYTAADAASDSAGAAGGPPGPPRIRGRALCYLTPARRSPAAAARMDFSRLRGLGLGRFPEWGEPIDPSENGPLGPLWPGEKRGAVVHPPEEWKFGDERT